MIILHLPFPPSANRLWRHTRKGGKNVVYIDAKYAAWKREADAMFLSQKLMLGERIKGGFTCFVTLDETRRRRASDVDNRLKAVLDSLQRWEVIENDKLADSVSVSWGPANGCIVALWPTAAKVAS